MNSTTNHDMFETMEHSLGLDAVDTILPRLHRTESDPRPVVVMTCGLSGAGKSTLAKGIINRLPHFTRLSIDTFIFERHGLYAIDYPADDYAAHQDEALACLTDELGRLLRAERRDVVLDLSFWSRESRREFKDIVGCNGGRDALKLDDEGRDGDSAFDVDDETFERYCTGFEKPAGEGEIVIQVA